MKKSDNTEQILEIITTMPGSTWRDVHTLMPHVTASVVTNTLHGMKARGIIRPNGRAQFMRSNGAPLFMAKYEVNPEGKPPESKREVTEPSLTALRAQSELLVATITELAAWKDDAIRRYPDLAVDPTVLKARKLAAQEVRAGGDHTLADQIVQGRKDDTLLMRVTIKALEEGND